MAVSAHKDEIEHTLDKLNGLDIDDEDGIKDGTQDEKSCDDDDDDDDDEENEFLHSSTFLSNSQIIRSSNVSNLRRDIEPRVMTSPTRRENTEENKENKDHFKLFSPKDQSFGSVDSTRSENSEDSEVSDMDIPADETVKTNERSVSRSSTRSRSNRFIDIDNPASTPKLPKINPETTPWRKLRPRSAFLDKESLSSQKRGVPNNAMPMNLMQSIFDSNSTGSEFNKSPARSVSLFEPVSSSGENSSSTTAASSYELENLRKQITNYKLQQRLLSELIRNILKESGKGEDFKSDIMQRLEKENSILLSQRECLQNEMKNKEADTPPLPTDSANKIDEAKYTEQMKQLEELKAELIATQSLNNELNSYLDELKSQLADCQSSLYAQSNNSKRWEQLVNELLTAAVNFLNPSSGKAVIQARDESKSLDTKLMVLSFALNEILVKYDQVATKLDTLSSEPTREEAIGTQSKSTAQIVQNGFPTNLKYQIRQKRAAARQVEEDLKTLLVERDDDFETIRIAYDSLQKKYTENVQFSGSLKKLLTEKRSQITELQDKIVRLETELEQLSDLQQSNNKDQETELLKNRLNVVKLTHSKEVENLKFEIEELKIEVERQNAASNNKGLEKELENRQREITELNGEIRLLNEKLLSRSRDSESQEHLKGLLEHIQKNYNTLQQDYANLEQTMRETQDDLHANEKDYKKKLEHAAKELGMAVAKQRALASEKHKATFSLEESNKEKSRLATNNNTLNEKVAKLSYQVSSLRSYEIGYKNLFRLQTSTIEGFLLQFENVLEPSSLSQAQKKLQKLIDEDLAFEQSYSIMRSLLAYLSNATASLIEDYSVLAGVEDSDPEELNRLREEIDKLREELQWCYDNADFQGIDDSPRTKLRINELEKLRKTERESRKQEHHAFATQIKTLEKENKELKEKLKRLGK